MPIRSSRQRGFTLLELAIALVVLGILIVMFNGLFKLVLILINVLHRLMKID
jgi:prepilin-type N-terminal cleavage/methylation domain-containing protein